MDIKFQQEFHLISINLTEKAYSEVSETSKKKIKKKSSENQMPGVRLTDYINFPVCLSPLPSFCYKYSYTARQWVIEIPGDIWRHVG